MDAVSKKTIYLFTIIVTGAQGKGTRLEKIARRAQGRYQLQVWPCCSALRIVALEQRVGEPLKPTCIVIQSLQSEVFESMRLECIH
ncbi:hypothetical protein HNS30_10650 [Corallococcus exercitus]|uniref:Uncharacterized protein n=1 Tax=Corallococcus exercitus TaxID=2316736 RepID=A0A7Y4ND29_9BACT|nr:hypothetical protein [Corallococcus exercitus]